MQHYDASKYSLKSMLQEETDCTKSLFQVDMHQLRVTLLLQRKLLDVYRDLCQDSDVKEDSKVPEEVKIILNEIFPATVEGLTTEKSTQLEHFPWQLFIERLGCPPDENRKERAKLVFKSSRRDEIARLGGFIVERLAIGDLDKVTKISLHESTWVVRISFLVFRIIGSSLLGVNHGIYY